MKNAFYFILKIIFNLRIFIVYLDFLDISKFMTSKPGEQTNTIHILPNISKSKDNQAMKFGQLIEYNKNIF